VDIVVLVIVYTKNGDAWKCTCQRYTRGRLLNDGRSTSVDVCSGESLRVSRGCHVWPDLPDSEYCTTRFLLRFPICFHCLGCNTLTRSTETTAKREADKTALLAVLSVGEKRVVHCVRMCPKRSWYMQYSTTLTVSEIGPLLSCCGRWREEM